MADEKKIDGTWKEYFVKSYVASERKKKERKVPIMMKMMYDPNNPRYVDIILYYFLS
jgi:hypothetical protein